MAGEPTLTIVGNVAGEPDIRYSAAGVAVLSFSVASTPRSLDRDSGNWIDGTTLWVRVKAFKKDAENASESLASGMRVIVTGRLQQDDWTDKEGNKRTSMNLLADEIGVSTKWATVKVNKAGRASEAPASKAPVDDPWASSAAPSNDSDIPF